MSVRILAIDTALDHCAACVAADDAEAPLSAETLAMARGHAEWAVGGLGSTLPWVVAAVGAWLTKRGK